MTFLALPSAPDPNKITLQAGTSDPLNGEPINLDGYTQVYGPLVSGETTGGIFVLGQSLSGNFVNATFAMTQSNAHMLNVHNGGVYNIAEPMVGCNGGRPGAAATGNIWSETVNKLRAAGWRQRVVVCDVAIGSTTSADWATGFCQERIRAGIKRMQALSLGPHVVYCDQGTSDTIAAFSATTVRDNWRAIVAYIRTLGCNAPVLVCRNAWAGTASVGTAPYLAVRQGQLDALDTPLGIFAGADTDTLNGSNRYDDIHWNATGRGNGSTLHRNAIVAVVP
jgi:hypothetical protein